MADRSLNAMAGGMGAGGGETLARRVANTRARQAGDAGTAVPSHSTAGFHPPQPTQHLAPTAPPQTKHCWYLGPYGRHAALLVRWRKVGDGYDGLILAPVPDGDGWALMEMWVESSMLERA